jgi:FkbM family methyltransferase
MRIAVVTPYHREADDVLRTCLSSVRDQTYADCRHFMVADGFPNDVVDRYATTHIRLPTAHGDNGNLGRCLGAFTAIAEGYDAVAFLDADNWYRPDHIARMVDLQDRTGAAICTSGRSVHRMDGTVLYDRDSESDGVTFADTSCLCVFRPAYDVIALWGTMPREAGPVCDHVMWEAIRLRGIARAHDPEPTVAFRTRYAFHYVNAGETPPPNAKVTDTRNAWLAFRALPYARRRGVMLGVGGVDDLSALVAARDRPVTPTEFVTLQGNGGELVLEVPDDEGIGFVLNEIFNQHHYLPVPGLLPPRTVLDIGANVGAAAAYFRLFYPDAALFCVEPDPRAYTLLKRNAEVIGNCETYGVGLHNGTQVRGFHASGASSVNGSAVSPLAGSGRQLMIDAGTFARECGSGEFDLIKIDTEGFEVPILLSLRQCLATARVILLEFHSHGDRRLIDEILSQTHYLWQAFVSSPHRGTLCFVNRTVATPVMPDQPLT